MREALPDALGGVAAGFPPPEICGDRDPTPISKTPDVVGVRADL